MAVCLPVCAAHWILPILGHGGTGLFLWFNTYKNIFGCNPHLPQRSLGIERDNVEELRREIHSLRRERPLGRNFPGALTPECFLQIPLSSTSQGGSVVFS